MTLRLLIELCLLRRGPEDLPYSPPFSGRLVALLLAVELAYAVLLEVPDAGPRMLLSIAWLLGVPALLLRLRQCSERYAQTLAALAGSGLLFTLALLPLALLADSFGAVDPQAPSPGIVLLGWLILLLLGWKLMINGHIWRHALDWPRFPALLLALALFMIEFGLARALFGDPPA